MKKRKIVGSILLLVIFATIAFIFSNSIPSKEESLRQSSRVKEIVEPVLEPIVGEGNVTDHLLRKLAHFVEFGVLGLELGLLFSFLGHKRISLPPFFTAIMVALTDETIQIFTGRGSQVQDVWLDFCGACTAFFLSIAIISLVKKIKQRNEATDSE